MFISTQAIPQVAQEYLSEVIMPKVPSQMAKFGLGFILPYLSSGVQTRIDEYLPALRMLGIVDENRKMDLDKAKSAATQALEKAGGKVTVAGYMADRDDIEALFNIAQRHATS